MGLHLLLVLGSHLIIKISRTCSDREKESWKLGADGPLSWKQTCEKIFHAYPVLRLGDGLW